MLRSENHVSNTLPGMLKSDLKMTLIENFIRIAVIDATRNTKEKETTQRECFQAIEYFTEENEALHRGRDEKVVRKAVMHQLPKNGYDIIHCTPSTSRLSLL